MEPLAWNAGRLLRKDTILVSVCAVDGEPAGDSAANPSNYGDSKDFPNCRLHVDATQAIGGKTELVMDGVVTREHRSSTSLRVSAAADFSPEKEQCDYRASDSRRFPTATLLP